MVVQEAAERHQIQNAIAALKKNRTIIENGFVDELVKAIAKDASSSVARRSAGSASSFSALSFDELELMGDDQVLEAVESARLQQVIRLACESGLAGISARLSTAQGFQVVKAESNLLRPEIMAQALLKLLQTLTVNSQTRGCWLIDGAQIMGDELQSLYVLLNDFLTGQGVAPAAYGVIASPETRIEKTSKFEKMEVFQTPQSGSLRDGSEPGKRAEKNESAQAQRKHLLTLDHLHRLLVGDYDSSFKGLSLFSGYKSEEVVHQDFSHTLPAALDVLAELEEQGLGTTTSSMARLAPPQPVAQLRAHLKTGAKSLGQSLAIEVVGVMIEQIANDDRLLLPVRQVVANAEPAFLRLAVTDPRFFSDKSHPARRLLEAITSSSLGYASENATGFPEFMHNLQEVAVLLTEEHASDTQHFATLLDDFERKQTRHSPENRQSQRRAEQALLQAELRNLVAVKIAAEVRLRPDFVEDNRIVSAFLTGPWAQVMAKERLLSERGNPDSQKTAFSLTLGDVLWSVDIAQASRHRNRLLKIIPELLRSLREGLLLIDYPLEQSRPFFEELMARHQAALKTYTEAPAPIAQTGHTLEKMFVTDEDDSGNAQPWLAPAEAQHSGFMQDRDVLATPGPSFDQPWSQGNGSAAQAALLASGQIAELHLGAWVELLVDTQWLRAQLTWVSPHNTLFMFTSAGGRKHSMTVRVLHHLLELEFVKVISHQGVIDSALDSVARTAMRNSVESS